MFVTGGFGSGIGFFASPRLRTTVANNGHLFALNQNSNDISVFDIQPDGSLTPVAGSPSFLGANSSSGAIAVAPAGDFLYASTFAAKIVKFSIDASGVLAKIGDFPSGLFGAIDGLEVHPSGGHIAATAPQSNQIAVLETATMMPAPFRPDPATVDLPV